LRIPSDEDEWRNLELYAGVVFDHGIVNEEYKGVHEWSVRRWTAFNLAINSVCGLLLSFPFGVLVMSIEWKYAWWIPVSGFALLLLCAAVSAWGDTMKMLEFMARLPPKQK